MLRCPVQGTLFLWALRHKPGGLAGGSTRSRPDAGPAGQPATIGSCACVHPGRAQDRCAGSGARGLLGTGYRSRGRVMASHRRSADQVSVASGHPGGSLRRLYAVSSLHERGRGQWSAARHNQPPLVSFRPCPPAATMARASQALILRHTEGRMPPGKGAVLPANAWRCAGGTICTCVRRVGSR